jgi:hypothetical protein
MLGEVMFRWWLVLTLSLVSTGARAQSGPPVASAVATRSSESAVIAAERQVAQHATHRAALQKRYAEEVAAIDRLKKQRASWRRDRDLRDSLSSSLETSNELDAATHEVDRAQRNLTEARRLYLVAIEAELRAGAAPPRTQQLQRAKLLLTSQLKDAPRRIVLPDLSIDPLADPEELLQRATELRASEEELDRQVTGLEMQAAELEHAAQLRKQHDRAGDLVNRYDDQPHRATPTQSGAEVQENIGSVGDPGRVPATIGTPPSSFEASVPTVLADVIDPSTITSFTAAQLSGDPAQRAQAARKAHDEVARRLDQVRRKRIEIETRARRLQGTR